MISEIRINNIYAHLYGSKFERNKENRDETFETMMKIGETKPIQKTKTLFTESIINRYRDSIILDHGMIPPNCRYIESVKDGNLIIIEEPPCIRTITMQLPLHNEIHQLKDEGKLEQYGYKDLILEPKINHFKLTLALPYVIFIFYIDNLNKLQISQIFFRTSQMFGLSDCLFNAPLPNISSDQDICLGSAIEGKSTLETVQKSIMRFWASSFNTDYLFNYEEYESVPIIRNYLEWEYKSKVDPMFIYNTEWLLTSNKSINKQLKYLKNRYNINLANKGNLFRTLMESFTKPTSVNKAEYPNKIKIKDNLYYDISNGIPLDYNDIILFLNIGDTVILNNGNVGYVESFIGDKTGIKYILIDLLGRKIHMRYTSKLRSYLDKNVYNQQISQTAIIKNGTVVSAGDIIEDEGYYKQIKYIRKSRGEDENVYELKIGNDYCFAHETFGTVIKSDRITVGSMVFEKDVSYILIKYNSGYNFNPINNYTLCKYKNIRIKSKQPTFNEFPLEFSKPDGEIFTMDSSTILNNVFIKEEELIEINETFRVGGMILSKNDKERDPNNKIYKYNNEVIYNEYITPGEEIEGCINGDTFFIAGADFDTSFHIGDKVITTNWDRPMDVLTIKTIINFEYNENENTIHFALKDQNDNISKQLYVIGYLNNILTGTIRKVTNQYNELYVGMKIKAKETKITRFPKKDTNIIVAIIIDTTSSPLILCSNGCTLWYSTVIERFDLIDIKSKRWNKLNHAELNMNNFSYQPGDIVKYHADSTTRYLIYMDMRSLSLTMVSLESYIGKGNDRVKLQYVSEIQNLVLDCIPTPRIAKNKISDNISKSYYNFHGGPLKEGKQINFGFIDY